MKIMISAGGIFVISLGNGGSFVIFPFTNEKFITCITSCRVARATMVVIAKQFINHQGILPEIHEILPRSARLNNGPILSLPWQEKNLYSITTPSCQAEPRPVIHEHCVAYTKTMYSSPLKRFSSTPASKKRKTHATTASASNVTTLDTAERLALPPVVAKKIQKHTSAFPNVVDLMKMVSEASAQRNGTLTDAELAVVLLKYYSVILSI